ncbi:hypothetical protein NN561_013723 [Cricetulus griseus]
MGGDHLVLARPRRWGAAPSAAKADRAEARPGPSRGGARAGRRAARQVWACGGGTARCVYDLRTTRDEDAHAGLGKASGKRARALARGEHPGDQGRGDPAGRVGSGARSCTVTRARPYARAARDPRARGNRSAMVTGALGWGVPVRPTHHFKLPVLGNFPGSSGLGGGEQKSGARGKPSPGRVVCFQSSHSGKRVFPIRRPSLGDPT